MYYVYKTIVVKGDKGILYPKICLEYRKEIGEWFVCYEKRRINANVMVAAKVLLKKVKPFATISNANLEYLLTRFKSKECYKWLIGDYR